jgi:hypothetical protein
MFYSQFILAKKGPLGKIWLAAHFEKKLTRQQIFSTDIVNTVDSLLNPAEPLSLRVSGHLMLGLVRIYSKKVKYLMVDCTDTVWKIQLAFKPGKVDIDPQQTNLNVDENKFFGNISTEMDYPVLENVAFAPAFLPVRERNERIPSSADANPKKIPRHSSTFEEFSKMHSPAAIEFARADERQRSSLMGSRMINSAPGTQESHLSQQHHSGKRSLLGTQQKFEDILPSFEEKMDTSLFGDLQFDPSFSMVDMMDFTHQLPTEEEKNQGEATQPQQSWMDGGVKDNKKSLLPPKGPQPEKKTRKGFLQQEEDNEEDEEEENEAVEEEKVTEKAESRKKRKIQTNTQIEMTDAVWNDIVVNRDSILRRKVDDPLPFQLGKPFKSFDQPKELTLEDRVFNLPSKEIDFLLSSLLFTHFLSI